MTNFTSYTNSREPSPLASMRSIHSEIWVRYFACEVITITAFWPSSGMNRNMPASGDLLPSPNTFSSSDTTLRRFGRLQGEHADRHARKPIDVEYLDGAQVVLQFGATAGDHDQVARGVHLHDGSVARVGLEQFFHLDGRDVFQRHGANLVAAGIGRSAGARRQVAGHGLVGGNDVVAAVAPDQAGVVPAQHHFEQRHRLRAADRARRGQGDRALHVGRDHVVLLQQIAQDRLHHRMQRLAFEVERGLAAGAEVGRRLRGCALVDHLPGSKLHLRADGRARLASISHRNLVARRPCRSRTQPVGVAADGRRGVRRRRAAGHQGRQEHGDQHSSVRKFHGLVLLVFIVFRWRWTLRLRRASARGGPRCDGGWLRPARPGRLAVSTGQLHRVSLARWRWWHAGGRLGCWRRGCRSGGRAPASARRRDRRRRFAALAVEYAKVEHSLARGPFDHRPARLQLHQAPVAALHGFANAHTVGHGVLVAGEDGQLQSRGDQHAGERDVQVGAAGLAVDGQHWRRPSIGGHQRAFADFQVIGDRAESRLAARQRHCRDRRRLHVVRGFGKPAAETGHRKHQQRQRPQADGAEQQGWRSQCVSHGNLPAPTSGSHTGRS